MMHVSHALDDVRMTAPLEIQEAAAELFDEASSYWMAVCSGAGLQIVNDQAQIVAASRSALLMATGREVLPAAGPRL